MRRWFRRMFILFCVVNLHPLLVLGIGLGTFLSERWFGTVMSAQEALECILKERRALGIPDAVVIRLVLVNADDTAETRFFGPDGPFIMIITRGQAFKSTVRHEMYHIRRIWGCRLPADSDPASLVVHWLRYWYIEEPFAVLYDSLGLKLGFC